MGPAATWDFCRRLLDATPAERDQDHLRVLVDCDPSVPDRSAALAGEGPSPAPRLAAMARGLERSGAELLCMPCNSAHAFADAVRAATSLPFVDMIDATVEATLARAPDAARVALLATTATLDAGLYRSGFAARGVAVATPTPDARRRMMAAIYDVKRGAPPERPRTTLRELAAEAVAAGAEAVIAACTEVPLALRPEDVEVPLIASTEALAVAVARRATER
jgi:aspartate racemase